MDTIRITKSQKFDVAVKIAETLRKYEPDFCIEFPGTENKAGVSFDLDNAVAFFKGEKETLARKNANSSDPGKMSDTQKENEEFKNEIKEYLATLPIGDEAPAGYSATDIFLNTSISKKNYQLPKVTALLTQLGDGTKSRPGTHEIVRVKGPKGQTLFRLA